jgi:Peptidase A4 family
MTVRLFVKLAALLAGVVFVGNAAAASGTSTSSNWAGYAVSPVDSTASYKTVAGTWVQPTATCSGNPAYAAFWVGLGGLDSSSQALEQIGTGAGCDQSGTPTYDAWYELVPAASVDLRLPVRAGDTMSASVTVSGHSVVLRIRNVTLGAQVVKKLRMRAPETSSAEWIAEAPSTCTSYGRCSPLRLANFNSVAFTKAAATAGGHTGTISDPAWTATAIALQEDGFFQSRFGSDAPPAGALPGSLSADGSAFGISWLQTSQPAQPDSPPAQPDSPPAA